MTNNDTKSIPVWAVAALGGGAAVALAYFVFFGGIAPKDAAANYRAESGTNVVIAEVADVPERNATTIAQGQGLYTTACAACHGMNHEGGVGPSLTDGEFLHPPGSETNVYNLVNRGIDGSTSVTGVPMPARGLNPGLGADEIWSIVFYLSSLNSAMIQDAPAP